MDIAQRVANGMHVHTLMSLSEGRDPAWRAGMEEVRLISLAGSVVV